MLMGRQIGSPTFLEYQSKYNFGLKTNIDLYGESRTDSLIFSGDTMGETELATSTFGQGFNVTMIQMITGFCSLINGGYYYEPHMVSKITASDGSVVKTITPRVLKQTISEQTSADIVDYCIGVVEEGTGKEARPAGYRIGGKTGTAEMVPRDRTNYLLSFMGFAPADNPQIAIYIVVDRPNSWVQDNVGFARKLCKQILTEVLPYMNIYMTEELSEKEEAELAELNITIKKAAQPEEEEQPEVTDAPDIDEEGNIDPHGGDVTSSNQVTEEEMNSDDVELAPLTGNVLNVETGEAVRENTDEVPY
jgi:stage V sporulation protein D (sporulation-specific penicillin-binding protein)